MAQRVYGVGSRQIQDSKFQALVGGIKKIIKMEYIGQLQQNVGSQLWGTDDITDGLWNKVFVRTGLVGTAAKVADNFRQNFPSATHFEDEFLISGMRQLGIAYDYFPEDWQDVPEQWRFVTDLVSDLPVLLADAEDDEHHSVYNNGETLIGGVFGTPLFVDGNTNKLQLIGRPTYFAGSAASNILYGGISYALLDLLRQYGDNFINEQGVNQRVEIDMIVASVQNAELLEMYYGASHNIETGNANIPNPTSKRSKPKIVGTNRIANRNDLWVFYKGWEQTLKERSPYRGKADSWTEGHAQFERVISQIRSRYGYYWTNNRLVLLVKGSA